MSDLNNQEKLEEVYKMTHENNEMLHSMLRQQYLATAFRVVYWLVILGAIGSTYYFIGPIVRPIISAFTSNSIKMEDTIGQLNQLRTQFSDKNLLNEVVKNLKPQVVEPSDKQVSPTP